VLVRWPHLAILPVFTNLPQQWQYQSIGGRLSAKRCGSPHKQLFDSAGIQILNGYTRFVQ
jgi:hypothetical protein